MATTATTDGFQLVGQTRVDRKRHVWTRMQSGKYKCVLCGGLAKTPTDHDTPDSGFVILTDADYRLCPFVPDGPRA